MVRVEITLDPIARVRVLADGREEFAWDASGLGAAVQL